MATRVNSTNRVALDASDISITLHETGLGYEFSFSLNKNSQPRYQFPPIAEIRVEAYCRKQIERFTIAAWGKPLPNNRFRITRFKVGDLVKFRVKIVDPSKPERPILGYHNDYSPTTYDRSGIQRNGILPFNTGPLGERIWAVEWDHDITPKITLNERAIPAEQVAITAGDPYFISLVLPTALGIILERLLSNGVLDDSDNDWAKFVDEFATENPPSDHANSDSLSQESKDWITKTVDAFCSDQDILRDFQQSFIDQSK